MNKCRNLQQNIIVNPIEIQKTPMINKNTKIFTIGSCFALELKEYLLKNSYNVLGGEDDKKNNGDYVEDPQLIWYNTFNILREFELADGKFSQLQDDVWNLKDKWQDPYRRCVFAPTKDLLLEKIKKLDKKIIEGILNAECIIITLGLTEVWFQPHNNLAICSSPGYSNGGGHNCHFKNTSYNENYKNMESVVNILQRINENCKIIITVSPVPLGMTYNNTDHIIANTESKSILRAVAGELTRTFNNVYYFHSYELAMNNDKKEVFIDDARHIKKEFVGYIMKEFEKNYII